MDSITLNIVTSEGTQFTEEADFIKVPGQVAEVGILPNHSPSLVVLKPGPLEIKKGPDSSYYFIPDGIAHILTDQVTVITSDYEKAEDINQEKVENSKKEALQNIETAKTDQEKKLAEEQLQRAEERLYICTDLR